MGDGKIEIGDIMGALSGVSFPADKAALIDKAKDNDASETVIGYLAHLPSGEYSSVTEITSALKDKY